MEKPFTFKQFTVYQDKCAMKIGTDGVLLGAWADPKNAFSILDIGSGSGVVSLQMAQKSCAEVIDAIEIDADAFEQTVENFERSDWGDRLFCYHASLQEFVQEMEDETYDFIISNPPFYNATYKSDGISEKRALARHTETLSFDSLLDATSKLLSEIGTCAFIIPFQYEDEFLKLANQVELFPNRIARVKGKEDTPIKRSLLQLSFKNTAPKISELILEIERHVYTSEYIALVKDFYLKM
jgi:tRNA1Val (adenine37-N6)-methyltransferase